MLVTNLELQTHAKEGGYAIGAFNTSNLEITLAIVKAAEALSAPVIIQTSPSAIAYAGLSTLSKIILNIISESTLPIALHLDHGTDITQIAGCVESGYSSVMIDGSKKPFKENIHITRQAVEIAHQRGVSVEGELGRIMGAEDLIVVSKREASMTDPDEAETFARESAVDTLAVSIGNAHGWYKEEPRLDFERLKKISENVEIPIVLHGASGLSDEDIRKAVSLGVTKINIDTEIRHAFRNAVKNFVNSSEEIDPRKILKPAIDAIEKVVSGKIKLFGSEGKAGAILRR